MHTRSMITALFAIRREPRSASTCHSAPLAKNAGANDFSRSALKQSAISVGERSVRRIKRVIQTRDGCDQSVERVADRELQADVVVVHRALRPADRIGDDRARA